jgi:predicted nucleic acid-binding protein
MRYLLDTSALLAHYRDEDGAAAVQQLIEDDANEIFLTSLSLVEFARRLIALGATPEEALTDMAAYESIAGVIAPADARTARIALDLAVAARERLPLIDALIAAAACQCEAVLVHRDAHFSSLPKRRLKQLHLGTSA